MMDDPGMITSQIIQKIIDSPLVIADLTESNPNVFYELAIRHAIRKPLVQIIQKGDKIPFDVAGMRTIQVDHKDLDSVDEAKKDIERQIQSIESKSPEEIDSPISVSIELQALRQSDNPEQRSLAEFMSVISGMRSDIAGIEMRLSEPYRLFPPELLEELSHRTHRQSKETNMINHEILSLMRHLRKNNSKNEDIQSTAMHIEDIIMRSRHDF